MEIKKEHKYDFSLNTVGERSDFIDKKLGFIFNMKPHILMGYSSDKRDNDEKFDRVPKLIDGYTTYFLKANDAGSSRKTEYSYYTCRKDEMRRKGNQELYAKSEPFDRYESDDEKHYSVSEVIADKSVGMKNADFGYENLNTSTIKYAISKGKLNKTSLKKLLSYSADILLGNEDEELKGMIEQLIFNCYIQSRDDVDEKILELYVQGFPLREISEKMSVGKSTVDRRINNLMSWVGQN